MGGVFAYSLLLSCFACWFCIAALHKLTIQHELHGCIGHLLCTRAPFCTCCGFGSRFVCIFHCFALLSRGTCLAASGHGYGRADGLNVTVDSANFDVTQGPPAWLRVEAAAGFAWAGGQPFGVQPSVAVVDKGGNIVNSLMYDDLNQNMTVTLISSSVPGAELTGRDTVPIVEGVADFLDLSINLRGSHVLEFESSYDYFSDPLTSTVEVLFSSEFQVCRRSFCGCVWCDAGGQRT